MKIYYRDMDGVEKGSYADSITKVEFCKCGYKSLPFFSFKREEKCIPRDALVINDKFCSMCGEPIELINENNVK